MTSADLTRCEDRFRMLFKLQDSHQVSTAEAAAMLHASGFSPDVCAEILHDMVPASPDQCTTIPTPISLFAEPGECGASGAHCAPPNDTALMGMSSLLLPSSANTPNAKTPRRHLAFRPTTIGSLPPGSPLLQPATTCAPWRTTSLAASAAIGIGDELSTMEMADRSSAIPIMISPLPPGSPLLKPATMCEPQRTTGMAASDAIGIDDALLETTCTDPMGRIIVPDDAGRMPSLAMHACKDGFRHDTDPTGLLPSVSPLPKPATLCAPLRTDVMAAGMCDRAVAELSTETADRMAIPITTGSCRAASTPRRLLMTRESPYHPPKTMLLGHSSTFSFALVSPVAQGSRYTSMRGESALYGPDGSATRELALQLRADLPGVTSMRQIQILADTMVIRLIIANEATPTDPAFEIRLDLPGVCDSDAVGAKWSTRTRVLRVMLPLMPTQDPKAVRRLMTINSLAADLATPTSDGSWPDELPPLVASSDEDDDWSIHWWRSNQPDCSEWDNCILLLIDCLKQ